ncbi:MAG: CDP-archaeol synthase [Candidatus Saccharibacteria bacterium]|nr:CDP-archaeol synthase [Candidatus Saccharibacteria bacterium]
MKDILTLIWLFLPMGIANMGPVLANNIPILKRFNQPLDFGKTFRGKRIFGSHKTIRGILAGTLMGLLVVVVQIILSSMFEWPESVSRQVDYSQPVVMLMGLFMGFGAMAGDAIKSFFKRQIGVEPGHSWVPFDQLDFVLGGLVASLPFFILPLNLYLLGLFIALVLHPTVNVLAWILRLQDKPF